MQKLYYENQYEKDFTAEIIKISEKNNEFHIELDKTCFYPESGGQPCDSGYIESLQVLRVYEENGVIYHVTAKKPIKIHRVKCSIDWEKRFDNMQQHLGQHILSAAFSKCHNAHTIGFHLGENHCTIDINKFLCENDIQCAEDMANDIICNNIKLNFFYPTKSELKKLNLKKIPQKTQEQIRIVEIKDIDVNPCCGVHPSSTIEVQLIKIIKFEKYKGSTRIEFLCGKRAISNAITTNNFASKICKFLNSNKEEALVNIDKMKADLIKTINENKVLKSTIADYEIKDMLNSCDEFNDVKVIKLIYNNVDIKYLNLISSKLTSHPNVIALLGVKYDDKCNLMFSCSKNLKNISMNSLLKDAITLIDGNGGGSGLSAQGGGKSISNIESALDYALMKIKTNLT